MTYPRSLFLSFQMSEDGEAELDRTTCSASCDKITVTYGRFLLIYAASCYRSILESVETSEMLGSCETTRPGAAQIAATVPPSE